MNRSVPESINVSTWLSLRFERGTRYYQLHNRATGFKCKGSIYPVSGYVYGDKIVFSVRWKINSEDYKSLTSWAGYLSNGHLVADWMLAYTDASLKYPFQMLGNDCVFGRNLDRVRGPQNRSIRLQQQVRQHLT